MHNHVSRHQLTSVLNYLRVLMKQLAQILLAALLFADCSIASGAEPNRFTVDTAVTRALSANPQIVAAKQQIFGATEGVRAAAGQFGPSANVSYYGRSTNTRTEQSIVQDISGYFRAMGAAPGTGAQTLTGQTFRWGDAFIAGLDLNLSQPIFTGFKLLSSYQKAKLAKDQADSLYKRTELVLIRSVQTAYFSMLKAKSDVKSNKDSVLRLQSQLNMTKAFYDVGLRPQLDVLQAESDLASAEQSLLAAENSVDVQKAQLNALLNMSLNEEVDYAGDLVQPHLKLSLQEALDEAYRYRPDILIAVKSVEIAEKDASIALSPILPQVRADYDYKRQGDTWWLRGENVPFVERHQIQLSITWKAWDWGSTIFSYRQANDNVKKLQADLTNLRLNVGAEVKTQYLNMMDAGKRIGVAKTGLVAASEGYRMAVARYQAQVGTNTDVLDAQARVSRAEFQVTQALTDYLVSIANINYAIGKKCAEIVYH